MKKLNKRIKEKKDCIEAYAYCSCFECACVGSSFTKSEAQYRAYRGVQMNYK